MQVAIGTTAAYIYSCISLVLAATTVSTCLPGHNSQPCSQPPLKPYNPLAATTVGTLHPVGTSVEVSAVDCRLA